MLGERRWPIFLLIYAAALAIRVVYVNQIERMPMFDHPIMDERYHVQLVKEIVGEAPDHPEAYFRAPLYPWLLSVWYRMTDGSFYWMRLLQVLLTSLLPALTYLLLVPISARRVAFWTAALLAFYPMFLYYDSSLLIESIMPLLCLVVFWLLYRAERTLAMRDFLLSGIALGIAALARPNILLFGPVLFIWLWLVIAPKLGWQKALGRYVLIAVAALIVILPVTIRNYWVSDDFVLISWQGGVNFFIGNNHQSNGWSATIPGVDETWEGGYRETIAIPEQTVGHSLKPSEISDFWYDAAWKDIGDNKGGWIALLWKKFRLLINGYEIPNNQSDYLTNEFAPIIRPLLWAKTIYFPFGIIAPLSIVGMLLSLKQWRRFLPIYLFLAAFGGSLVFFFVCARFRQPMLPFLIFFAVYAIARMIQMAKNADWKTIALCLVGIVLLGIESNHNLLGIQPERARADEYSTIGTAYFEQEKIDQATIYFRKAIGVDSGYAPGYLNLGILDQSNRRWLPAAEMYQKAIARNPELYEAYVNLTTVFLEANRIDDAINVMRSATARFPLNSLVHLKLGMTLFEGNRIDEGISAVQRAIELNPNDSAARRVLVQMQQYQDSLKQP